MATRRRSPATTAVLSAEQRLDADMQQYAGKWVAVVRRRIVAVGDSLKAVADEAAAKGYKDPLIMRAPEQGVWIL